MTLIILITLGKDLDYFLQFYDFESEKKRKFIIFFYECPTNILILIILDSSYEELKNLC